MEDAPYDFSFSGVKSAVLKPSEQMPDDRRTKLSKQTIAASLPAGRIVDVLVDNAIRAAKRLPIWTV